MQPSRILHVGYDDALIAMRSRVLRSAGYAVEESGSVNNAIYLVESDLIDAVLICHTIPKSEQQLLVTAVKSKRRLLPLLCLRAYSYESTIEGCTVVENEPVALLNAVRLATKPQIADSASCFTTHMAPTTISVPPLIVFMSDKRIC
jgi:CheY-like chemotaxis protein